MRNGFETTDVERGSPVLTSHTCACTHTLYHSGLSQVCTMDPGPHCPSTDVYLGIIIPHSNLKKKRKRKRKIKVDIEKESKNLHQKNFARKPMTKNINKER